MRGYAAMLMVLAGCVGADGRQDPTDPALEVPWWEVQLMHEDGHLYNAQGRGQPDWVNENRPQAGAGCSASFTWFGNQGGMQPDGEAAEITWVAFDRSTPTQGVVVPLGRRWASGSSVSDGERLHWSLSHGMMTVQAWGAKERIATVVDARRCDWETSEVCTPIEGAVTLSVRAIEDQSPELGTLCTEGVTEPWPGWDWGDDPPPCAMGEKECAD